MILYIADAMEIEYPSRIALANLPTRIEKLARLSRELGGPAGATNELGIWGYIKAAQEIQEQLAAMNFKMDAIITAVGTGGTLAGLLVGRKLFNLDSTIYGVNVEGAKKCFLFTQAESSGSWGINNSLDRFPEVYRAL